MDGRTLLLLDDEDYENMMIRNRIQITKIRVEMEKLYRRTNGPQEQMTEAHAARREKIRRQKIFHAAAILIQRNFRIFTAKKELALRKEIERIARVEEEERRRIAAGELWYTELDIPSKLMTAENYDDDSNPVPPEKGADLSIYGKRESEALKLPPIKNFGRNRDHLSASGWGRRGGLKGDWIPTKAAKHKEFIGDSHPSRVFTEKLHISGYDERRMKQFKAETHLF